MVYRFEMESNVDERTSILITNDMIECMGVSHEQLREDALENAPEIRPAVIQGMNEIMKEMMGAEVYEMLGFPDETDERIIVIHSFVLFDKMADYIFNMAVKARECCINRYSD